VFYVGHVDKSSLYETHCNILRKHHHHHHVKKIQEKEPLGYLPKSQLKEFKSNSFFVIITYLCNVFFSMNKIIYIVQYINKNNLKQFLTFLSL
jgi:hypothetical protein